MTLDEFLDTRVPNELKPMGDWSLVAVGAGPSRQWMVRRGRACPLTAPSESAVYGASMARDMGLSGLGTQAIISASDDMRSHVGFDAGIRARLLAGLGLSEPGGERGSR